MSEKKKQYVPSASQYKLHSAVSCAPFLAAREESSIASNGKKNASQSSWAMGDSKLTRDDPL